MNALEELVDELEAYRSNTNQSPKMAYVSSGFADELSDQVGTDVTADRYRVCGLEVEIRDVVDRVRII